MSSWFLLYTSVSLILVLLCPKLLLFLILGSQDHNYDPYVFFSSHTLLISVCSKFFASSFQALISTRSSHSIINNFSFGRGRISLCSPGVELTHSQTGLQLKLLPPSHTQQPFISVLPEFSFQGPWYWILPCFVYTCSFLAREGLSSYEFTWIKIRIITLSKHLTYLPNFTSVKRTLGNVYLDLFLFGSYTGLNTDPCMISKHSITELYSISNALGNVNLSMSNTLPKTKSYCDVYYTFTELLLTLMDCETQDQMSKYLWSQKHLIRTQIQVTCLCSHTYYQLQVQILRPEMLGKHQHYCNGYSWLSPWLHPELSKTPVTGHTSFEVERSAGTSSFIDKMDTWNFCSKVAIVGLAGSPVCKPFK